MNDRHDNAPEDHAPTAGGGAHDITGAEAAEHVGQPSEAAHGAHVAAHGAHAAAHGESGEDQPLGPIDWRAWGAAVVGVGVAALMCLLFHLAIAA